MARPPSFLSNPDSLLTTDGLLHAAFEETARRFPSHVAVECGGETATYKELEAHANRFAYLLRRRGVRKGGRICLLLNKSVALYAAMLGALKAGVAYVPLDPSYPEERLRFIAEDSGAALFVAASEFRPLLHAVAAPQIFFPEIWPLLDAESPGDFVGEVSPDNEAYVIYTSGTTGQPKGVLVSHRNVRHLIEAERALYGVRPDDRVFQGFSVAFDASVEEIWSAFAAGATLVAGTPEILRSGPDLGKVLAELRVTVLSTAPTLLSLFPGAVPSVRLLILGGEVLPAKLLEPWHDPARRIFNTYGPTETTVIAAYCLCGPGKPVALGKPLANYTLYVAGEDGALLEQGREGELLIGGPGVAKGYLNRDELTRRKFIPNPYAALTGDAGPVLYRTGDRVRISADGELEYLGRLDSQVKIRGFRVELGEIESLLLKLPGVRNAAAVLHNGEGPAVLAAYVLLEPRARFDEAAALAEMRKALPPYMVPALIDVCERFPTTSGGKVDRAAFPRPRRRAAAATLDSPLKQKIHDLWAGYLGVGAIPQEDNLFADWGVHSLWAARFVSEMRKDPRYAALSMRDIYAHPSIAALAELLEERKDRPSAPAPPPRFHEVPASRYRCSALAQAAILYVVTGVFTLQWLTPFLVFSFLHAYEWPLTLSLLYSLLSLCAVYPAMLLFGVATKWVLLGRLKEGDYPLWGAYYLRWLLVQRLLDSVPTHFLAGTPLMPWYCRLLGAKVGRDVYLNSGDISGLDLLSIGDRSSVNADANISCHSIEDGLFKLRRVKIGRDVFVGVRAAVGLDVRLGDGSALLDLSSLPPGARVGAGQTWAGSPAARTKRPRRRAEPPAPERLVPESAALLFYSGAFLTLPTLGLLPVFPGLMVMYHLDYMSDTYYYLVLSPLVGTSFVLLSALMIVGLKWLIIGKMREGSYRLRGAYYMRLWSVEKLMETSLELLKTLYATLYLNPWYRALGVSVGPRAEVSTASFVLPDLLRIGEGSFIADDAGLGPAEVSEGVINLRRTDIGERTFIGNSAHVPPGSFLGRNCLLGCQTLAPEAGAPEGTSWIGSPAMRLPQRQKPAQEYALERTYHPTPKLYAQRLAIEFFRVILPATAFVIFTTLLLSFSVQIEDVYGPWVTAVCFPLLYLGMGAAAALTTAALKWLLVGRYRSGEHPLWSHFVWRTELVTGFCENFTNEFIIGHLQGTAFLPWYFRLLGMRVGKRACLMTLEFTEFDLVRLGDDVALNDECTIQTHLFEDRVMKMGTVAIGSRASVGSGSVILYDSALEDDVSVGDVSLVMKGERLGRGTRWAGSPVQRVEAGLESPVSRAVASAGDLL